MLLAIPPKYSVSSVMGYLKGKSSLTIFDKHANLKCKFGNRRFWAEGYYVSTVGLNEATIAKCIREQEAADIALDKLSVKEYSDPFKKLNPEHGSTQLANTIRLSTHPHQALYDIIGLQIRTTRIAGGLLLGYNPRAPGSRLKARARTSSRPSAS
mgnify:CR=1 FL=1